MKRPDFTDPIEAARVGAFIEAAQHGRWRIERFGVTEDAFYEYRARIIATSDSEMRRNLALDRQIPPGEYVSLQRIATEREAEENDRSDEWQPVMSDTPAEIEEHQHAIVYGTGRVLIHGLGLGVLVSALLAKPDVEHIDVVEIDPDVIALTGHYYSDDPRVTIHHADCLELDWSPDVTWDYVWHDIWTDISWKNLHPELAEHGITYDMMFDHFGEHTEIQGAWAYAEAQAMEIEEYADKEANRLWEDRFWASDRETQVEMVFEKVIRTQVKFLPDDQPIPQEFVTFFRDQGVEDQIRKNLGKKTREQYEADRGPVVDIPLGNPNEELKKNAAV